MKKELEELFHWRQNQLDKPLHLFDLSVEKLPYSEIPASQYSGIKTFRKLRREQREKYIRQWHLSQYLNPDLICSKCLEEIPVPRAIIHGVDDASLREMFCTSCHHLWTVKNEAAVLTLWQQWLIYALDREI